MMPTQESSIVETTKVTPIADRAEVTVVGGGPSGVAAAVSAARMGRDVLLVERRGFLGGTATGAMVASFMGFCWRDQLVSGGIATEILQRLESADGGWGFHHHVAAEASDHPYDVFTYPFDPEVLKGVLDELVRDAGVRVLHHASVVAPVTIDANKVGGVFAETRGGRQALLADIVVDAGADGFVARAAGAPAQNADQDRSALQPMTLMVRLADVDVARYRSLAPEQKRRLSAAGMATGELHQRILSVVSSPNNADAFALMTRIAGFDGSDSWQLGEAEVEGRRQARSLMRFLNREVPGFEHARLVAIAPEIGIRETWQVTGDYVLTGEDVLSGRQFDDGIALGGGPLDLHHPVGGDVTLLEPERPYATPYRCLLPRGVDRMLVTGRAMSSTPEAHGAIRHMGSAMVLGQASGVAAALAVEGRAEPRDVDPHTLRAALRQQGAILDLDDVRPIEQLHSAAVR